MDREAGQVHLPSWATCVWPSHHSNHPCPTRASTWKQAHQRITLLKQALTGQVQHLQARELEQAGGQAREAVAAQAERAQARRERREVGQHALGGGADGLGADGCLREVQALRVQGRGRAGSGSWARALSDSMHPNGDGPHG